MQASSTSMETAVVSTYPGVEAEINAARQQTEGMTRRLRVEHQNSNLSKAIKIAG